MSLENLIIKIRIEKDKRLEECRERERERADLGTLRPILLKEILVVRILLKILTRVKILRTGSTEINS